MTAAYTSEREQFGKPLSTFQGVALAAADAFVESRAIEAVAMQAAQMLNSQSMDADVDATCGAQSQQIGIVNLGDPPDLLVVLDRSGSMVDPPITWPPTFTSKWQIMSDALEQITMMKDQNIRFGLLEFPSDDNCAATATPKVPIGLGSAPAFASYFGSRMPGGNTPAYVALDAALTYFNSIQVNTAGDAQSSVLAYCASGSSNFFYLTSATQVLSTFSTIGTKLSKLRISR